MHNISLERFYKRIHKKILLVGSYTEHKYLNQVIKTCRLKPISVFSENFSEHLILERIWIDEFDHLLEIKKKNPKIKINNLLKSPISTDIYKYEKIHFILDRSQNMCIGLSDDLNKFILLLMGSDNYLRCYYYDSKQINYISPLTVGLKVLKHYFSTQTKCFKKLLIKSELQNFKKFTWFVVNLPIDDSFKPNVIGCDYLRRILYNE